jgi:hypothetical protein
MPAIFLQRAFEASRHRHRQIQSSGGKVTLPPVASPDDLAKQIGVSPSLLWQARQLHEAFAKDTRLKDKLHPRILAGENPLGLGAALATFAPREKSQTEKPPAQSRIQQFESLWFNLVLQTQSWNQFEPAERERARGIIREIVGLLPHEFLSQLGQEISRAVANHGNADETALQE